tara:strand:+ start:309 stop:635 length:327 start_codon:yes stop_codon:yes gene_type:complete
MEILLLISLGFLWLIWIIFKKPEPKNIFTELIEAKKKSSGTNFVKDYPGSPQYQALLKKYDGNIPGSGQGDRSDGKPKAKNLGWRYGTKGGKYNERISKKGNRYRQYY